MDILCALALKSLNSDFFGHERGRFAFRYIMYYLAN